MKIVYILPSFSGDFIQPFGGVETATINLILGILHSAPLSNIFLIFPNRNQSIQNLPKGVSAIPINSRFKNVWTFNYPIIGINALIEEEIGKINPDIIHVQGAPGFYRNFDKKKTFLTIHGIPYIDASFNKRLVSKLKSYITKLIFIRDIKRYNNVVFLVSYAYSLLKKNIAKNTNVFFIPNSISEMKYDIIENKNNIPVFLFSGILRPLKNIEGLILASYYVKKDGIKFQLKMAGSFSSIEYEKKVRALVKKYDLDTQITFLGQLNSDELLKTLNNIDINLLPSFQEVCPMSIIEAMTLGKPSIASSVGGIPEMIFNNYNGFLVPVGNTKELAHKMKAILHPEIYNKMGARCVEMSQMYSSNHIAYLTLDCYRQQIK